MICLARLCLLLTRYSNVLPSLLYTLSIDELDAIDRSFEDEFAADLKRALEEILSTSTMVRRRP